MPNTVQILRSPTAGSRPPAGKLPGEPYWNENDRALGVVNDAGAPIDLLAVRFFSETASYAPDDVVLKDGAHWSAKSAIPPGPWDIWQWTAWEGLPVEASDQVRFFVSATGSNQGDGSAAAPWATVARVIKYLQDYVRKIDGVVTIHIGDGVSGENISMYGGLTGTGTVLLVGAGSALTSITGITVYGARGTPSPVFALSRMTIFPIWYGVFAGSDGNIALVGGDLIIDMTNATQTPIGAGWGKITTAGQIEYRMAGKTFWSFIFMGQHEGPNCFEDAAQWVLSGTPDGYSWGFIGLFLDSTYIATGPVTFTGPPGGGIRFNVGSRSSVNTVGQQGAAAAAPGGLDYFPGTAPGQWDATSFYDSVPGSAASALDGGTF